MPRPVLITRVTPRHPWILGGIWEGLKLTARLRQCTLIKHHLRGCTSFLASNSIPESSTPSPFINNLLLHSAVQRAVNLLGGPSRTAPQLTQHLCPRCPHACSHRSFLPSLIFQIHIRSISYASFLSYPIVSTLPSHCQLTKVLYIIRLRMLAIHVGSK